MLVLAAAFHFSVPDGNLSASLQAYVKLSAVFRLHCLLVLPLTLANGCNGGKLS